MSNIKNHLPAPIIPEEEVALTEKVILPAELLKKFNRTKMKLMQQNNSAFISHILFSLTHVWDMGIKQCTVSSESIHINPEWFASQSDQDCIYAMVYEAWQVALQHVGRVGFRSIKRWNKASAYVINNMLEDAGYTVPSGYLVDHAYDNKTTEEVYDLLPEEDDDDDRGSHGGALGNSPQQNINPVSSNDPQAQLKQDKLEAKVDQADMQAQMSGQDAGDYPAELARFLDELHNPQLPWGTILQNYMSAYAKEDYSYAKPNRRFLPDFYLPSLHSEGLDEIAIAIDTSGSVSKEEFTAFLSEVNEIKERLKPQRTVVVDFDTQIKAETILNPTDDVSSVEFKGGGGTNLTPVFEHFEERDDLTVLIVFSDLYCNQIEEEPDYDVIWVCIDNPSASVKFGELIHFSTANI
jgi:predicted metal-dependent peptidase